jgi:O-antigen/teichoic acid export membrane protein
MLSESGTAGEQPATPAASGPSLKRAVFTSAVWTMVGWVVTQVLRFASTVILTRLLFPGAFGLMSLITVFIVGLHMFSDVGIGPALVQSGRGDEPDFYNTAWTVQILRGLALWVLSALIAWPVSQFYDQPGLPSLAWLLPAVGLATAISAFDSTALYTLDRHFAQGRRVALQIGSSLIALGVTVGLALVYPSVWTLVIGNLISAVMTMACSHMLVRGVRNRLQWDRSALIDLLRFGKWVLFSTACTFIGNQGDRLVIGKLSLMLLGVYHVGANLAAIPIGLFGTIAMQLIFPLYSRMLKRGRSVPTIFAGIHPASAGLAAFLVSGLIATGPTFVELVYDSRYRGAGWIVQILGVGAWFQMLEILIDAMLWGLAKAHVSGFSNLAKVLALAVLAPVGYWLYGVPGLIVGFVATDLVRYGVSMWYARQYYGAPILRYDLSLCLLIASVSLAALAVGEWLGRDQNHDWTPLLFRFMTEAGVVVLMWGLILVIAWHKGIVRTSWRES